jgi:hypothetical protein
VRWFYGAPNLVGAAGAVAVTGAFVVGVLSGPLVAPLVIGAYVLGAVATPRPKGLAAGGNSAALGTGSSLNIPALEQELQDIVVEAGSRLPNDLAQRVDAIAQTITEMLPLVQGASDREQLFVIERTVTDYLPTSLDNYLRLPRTYATTHTVADGKTPAALLADQLDLINEKMAEISTALASDDAGKLLSQGRFLEERFGRGDSSLSLPHSQGPSR